MSNSIANSAAGLELQLCRHLLDNATGPAVFIVEVLDDCRLLLCNTAARRVLGVPDSTLPSISLIELIPDLTLAKLRQLWQDAGESGTMQISSETFSPDGQDIVLTVALSRLLHPSRKLMVGYLIDLSERQRIEETLKFIAQRGWRQDGEPFALSLARYLGHTLNVDYVMISQLAADPGYAETIALLAQGKILPNTRYALAGSPCSNVMQNGLCCYPENVQQTFPEDKELADMQAASYVGLPLWSSHGNTIGLIAVMHGRPRHDTAFIAAILQAVATRLAAELEREQAEQQLTKSERELRTLLENLPAIVVRYDCDFRRVYVNPEYWKVTGYAPQDVLGKPPGEYWPAENISAETYKAVLAEVMRSGISAETLLEWAGSDGQLISHAVSIAPAYGADGKIDGLLTVGTDLSGYRRQQLVELERQRIFVKIAHGDDLASILEQVILYVESSGPGRRCVIVLPDESGAQPLRIIAPSLPASYRRELLALCTGNVTCPGWKAVLVEGKRTIVEDMRAHSCARTCGAFMAESGAVACWSKPIFSSSNQLLGALSLYLNRSGKPESGELALLLQATHLSSIAIEHQRIERQLHIQANYDTLTGMLNRRSFDERLREEISKAEQGGYCLAVLFIDLDHFKMINDGLGHAFGDRVLAETAQRIRSCLRSTDSVSRLGGDEFVAILPGVNETALLERTAQRIIDAMACPFNFDMQHAYVSASVGIAVYPRDNEYAETLIGCADQAMYAAKENGRNSYRFFSRAMQERSHHYLQLVNDLRQALDLGQFEVHYQPIIDAVNGRVVKAEALLRWHHHRLGVVPPEQFIPIAEDSGLIQALGVWVFREAVDMAKRWNGRRTRPSLRQISINMSPRQFMRGNQDDVYIGYLQSIGLNPAAIVLEITESLLLDDRSDVKDALQHFQSVGMQVALDDFGTGYSAMAYLKKFNIDYLKIDRSFVRDLETDPSDRTIAETIIVMAHSLGIKTIAEGVETSAQRDILVAAGCEYVQGYFYAEPMPAEAFLAYAD